MRVKVSEIRDAYQIPCIETFAEFLRRRLFVQQLIQVNKKKSYYCPFVKKNRPISDGFAWYNADNTGKYIYVMTSSRVKMLPAFRSNTLNTFMVIASCMAKCRYVIGTLRDEMDEILETIFSNAVVHIMARAQQTSCYYLNQWGPSLLTHTCSTRPRWVKANNEDINQNTISDPLWR